MQSIQFPFKKSIWLLLPVAITIFSLLIILSCNEGKNKETETKDLDLSCLTLTKTQINFNWVGEFTDPRNYPTENMIYALKFYTSINPKGGLNIRVQAFNKKNLPLGESIDLKSEDECLIDLHPFVMGMSNDIEISKLKIFKEDNGKLVDNFDEIILRPGVYEKNGYNFLQYEILVKAGTEPESKGTILPCPPCETCIPECPEYCIPKCVKIDTLKKSVINIIDTTISQK